jgi:hypothetical protein
MWYTGFERLHFFHLESETVTRRMTPKEFLTLDEQYGVLDFIGEVYEPFPLMGNQGILNEAQAFIDLRCNTHRPRHENLCTDSLKTKTQSS